MRLDLVQEPLTIAKKDLVRPPVLIPAPVKPAANSAAAIASQPGEAPALAEAVKPAGPVAENPVGPAAPEPGTAMTWGAVSVSLTGFVALRDIRTFRTYGVGGHLQYMLPAFFSERHRLFARLQLTRLVSENYDYLFLPVYAGMHSTIYQPMPQLALYGELAIGLGYFEFTRGDAEKDAWKGSVYLALGAGYFFTRHVSLNAELAGTYIARDQSAGNIVRLQVAAVIHL